MENSETSIPPPTQQISIADIIQIRVAIGHKDQTPTLATKEILTNLDKIILNFSNSLKGN